MSNARVRKSRIVEVACRTDFLSFFQLCFHILEPGKTLNMNWHHYAIAYHLELVLRGVIKRLIIVAPPRTLKSLMCSVAFPAYALGRNPAWRGIGISHGTDLQIKFCNECRAVIDSPRYRILFQGVQLSKSTETEFHTTQGGYRYARSAEGGLTGIGGGTLMLDDFQKPMDMFSEIRRTFTNKLYYNTVASRTDNQHTGAIIVVCQRLHPDDLVGILLHSAENWTVLNLPAIAVEGGAHSNRSGPVASAPCRRPPSSGATVARISRGVSLPRPRNLRCSISAKSHTAGGFMIKRDQIQYCDELPKKTSSSVYLQSWDTSQKPGEANARSACLDILVQDNKYFIAHAMVGQWDYEELERRLLSRANERKPNVILIEDAGFGTALIGTWKRKGLPVVAVQPEGDKKTRLLRHISKFANGQVFLLKTSPGRADLETELFSFPGGRRNDLVDALTQALAYKHVPLLLTPQAVANYGSFLSRLAGQF